MSRSVTVCAAAVLALFSATVFAANPYPAVPLYLNQKTVRPNIA
jgi:type IV pilus assembly protein PilY1